jgi:hypothetical protein
MSDLTGALPRPPSLVAPPPAPRDCILVWARALNGICAICVALCGVALGMAVIVRGQVPDRDAHFLAGQVVRLYGITLAVAGIAVESEWRLVFRAAAMMEMWIVRGFCYAFLAALTYREAHPSEAATDFQKSLLLYRSVASVALASCAAVYAAGGVCCLGAVRRARQRREDRYLAAEGEYEELERRRRELQRLLGRPAEP